MTTFHEKYSDAGTIEFGDSEELSGLLIDLVRNKRKTATCAALRDYKLEGEPVPLVDANYIVLDFHGRPTLVIQTTQVHQLRFIDVTWDFAKFEGEDANLESWRVAHQSFFERNGGFDPLMTLVCYKFNLIDEL